MNLASLDLNLLVTLDALLEHRSVSRAAEQVGLSQPAVSVYPDSDKVGVWVGQDEDGLLLPRSAAMSYFDGEA